MTKKSYIIIWSDHCGIHHVDHQEGKSEREAFQTWADQFSQQTIQRGYSIAECSAIAQEVTFLKEVKRLDLHFLYDLHTRKPYPNTWHKRIDYRVPTQKDAHLSVYLIQNPPADAPTQKQRFTFLLYHHAAGYALQYKAESKEAAFDTWKKTILAQPESWFTGHTPRTCEWLKKAIAREAKVHQPSPMVAHPHTYRWRFFIGQSLCTLYMVATRLE